MDAPTFLLQLVFILISARLFGELAAYFQIPTVIGELVAGIIIGPSVLGLIEISNPIHLLAQIGIILLLFEVGIETDIGHLSSAGGKAFIVALGGVILPLVLGFFVSYYLFDFSLLASLFIACTLTATSIGITLRVLRDLKKQDSHEAQIIIGAAVFDDIIGIVLLTMLYEFSVSGEINLWSTAKVLLFIILFFLISPILAKGISYIIQKWDKKSDIPGLLPTTIVSLILFFAWMAHSLGAPELLGGFAAGLALSRQFFFPFAVFLRESKEFSHSVEKQMKPIIHLFTPIFFVAIGLSLDLKVVSWDSSFIWLLTGILILVAIAGKLFSAFFLKGENRMTKWVIGMAMIPRGEVGLIFANVGLDANVFTNDVYAALILVITFTTLIAPFSLRWFYTKQLNA
ncbi:cation:proton antiporter [Candidatus Protochlamydia phocaeensis]|uniref:cation:proton antiporter n=1 Tax=Candidatus Protochlamydia phocaeensis TaxID=1414722 RepID=UPI0008397BE1|nr:cation:proton antiporter [Candidatus Protochlamydia phocaeensis]